jgi:ribosomal protein S18 acetylase RimI-like enzyme
MRKGGVVQGIQAGYIAEQSNRKWIESRRHGVSTPTAAAIRLWQELGFEIAGTLPGAFRHPEKGYVDVYVMYRSLVS